jgi:hypothetical protein
MTELTQPLSSRELSFETARERIQSEGKGEPKGNNVEKERRQKKGKKKSSTDRCGLSRSLARGHLSKE